MDDILAATYPRPPNHKTSDAYWVGINQRATKGEWKFEDGESYYSNKKYANGDFLIKWHQNEPEPRKNEFCAGLALHTKHFHDWHCGIVFPGICEIPI